VDQSARLRSIDFCGGVYPAPPLPLRDLKNVSG